MPRLKRSRTEPLRLVQRYARDDAGSAALEFVTAGLILLVPLVYLVVTLAAVQGGALAVEGAARQAARVFVQAQDPGQAEERAARAIEFGLSDYGIPADSASVSVSCSEPARACPARNAVVTITVRVEVPLPLVPDVLNLDRAATIPVEATARQQVSRFWAEP
ncbi:TadE family protein [Mycetocola manganoxydans]|uniref:TadE family protein n=1 Tax=Mycetocola manganoxydans TaxID=699879 RepID=A0A3L6ZS43_9MICO|nr:TadE family protein [Mycetocola manganoxydans]RLP70750.1 TadE family protein [Mycetocola manganoxydans]GHD48541.1 hypothetical protein GCM10008097_20630 [Mycetocola manganoxydans]